MSHHQLDISPPINRTTKDSLDRDVFKKSFTVLAASVPATKIGMLQKSPILRNILINIPKIRGVVPDPDSPSNRLLLLGVSDQGIHPLAGLYFVRHSACFKLVDIPQEARAFLAEQATGFSDFSVELDYDYWSADEILQSVLPEELCEGTPTGFSSTGHIAHLNLNAEYLPYKHLIGEVILDKNKHITTVVNKLDSIANQFRFFKMELLAGEPNYIVQHNESDCRFTFDFTNVYWNSRLGTEHKRLVSIFSPEDVVADVFAGVGPFVLPAAKRGCAVWANDLNPESVKWLASNVTDNKVSHLVRTSCEDGRDFIRNIFERSRKESFPAYKPKLSKAAEKARDNERRRMQKAGAESIFDSEMKPPPRGHISHFVMNLPDSAITFLDAFRGVYSPSFANDDSIVMPMIHCHCFTRELERDKAVADIRERVEEKIGHALKEDVLYHLVRSVAPNKEMYCVSFRLPREVAFEI